MPVRLRRVGVLNPSIVSSNGRGGFRRRGLASRLGLPNAILNLRRLFRGRLSTFFLEGDMRSRGRRTWFPGLLRLAPSIALGCKVILLGCLVLLAFLRRVNPCL